MAIGKLAGLARGALPVRDVVFALNDFGSVAHTEDEKEPADVCFRIKARYISSGEVNQAHQDSMVRRAVANAKAKGKAMVPDGKKAQTAICQKVIQGWSLTVAGARALECTLDFGGSSPEEPIVFSPENVGVMVQHSNLGQVVENLLADYSYWFPDDKAQEGNSQSGPASSMAESRAQPASTGTEASTRPNAG